MSLVLFVSSVLLVLLVLSVLLLLLMRWPLFCFGVVPFGVTDFRQRVDHVIRRPPK